jgi:hypothetical protein
VSEAGGAPQLVAMPDSDANQWTILSQPEILPSGDTVLVDRFRLPDLRDIIAVSLSGGHRKQLLPDARGARYVPTGHLIYSRSGRLMAAPFDPIRVEVTGPSVVMLEGVNGVDFDFGTSGTLLYALGTNHRFKLVWVDRTGVTRQVGSEKAYHQPALSPDGRRIAVNIEKDIWVYDLEQETLTRVTFNGGYWPIWTPDGTRLTYVTLRNGVLNVVWKNANGTGDEEQLTTSPNSQSASSWSADWKLAFQNFHPNTSSDIWLLDSGHGRTLRCLLCTDAHEGSPALSPDGKWIAYTSDDPGLREVYVRPVEGSGKKYPISNGPGYQPLWSRNGKELFYWKGAPMGADPAPIHPMQMMVVDLMLDPVFRAAKPRVLFAGSFLWGGRANYDVSADGQQFLMLQPVQSAPITQLELVVNWFEELRARVQPTAR